MALEEERYLDCIDLDGLCAVGLQVQGVCAARLGKREDAFHFFETALFMGEVEELSSYHFTQLQMESLEELEENRSIEMTSSALQFLPPVVETSKLYTLHGVAHFNAKHYQKCVDMMQRALKVDEKNVAAWFLGGICFARLKVRLFDMLFFERAIVNAAHQKHTPEMLDSLIKESIVETVGEQLDTKNVLLQELLTFPGNKVSRFFHLHAITHLEREEYLHCFDFAEQAIFRYQDVLGWHLRGICAARLHIESLAFFQEAVTTASMYQMNPLLIQKLTLYSIQEIMGSSNVKLPPKIILPKDNSVTIVVSNFLLLHAVAQFNAKNYKKCQDLAKKAITKGRTLAAQKMLYLCSKTMKFQ